MQSYAYLFFVFFVSFPILLFFRRYAPKLGLIDIPDSRKNHNGNIPVVGGISIFISVFLGFFFSPVAFDSIGSGVLIISLLILIFAGIQDDRKGTPVSFRLSIESISVFLVYSIDGVMIQSIGDIIFIGDIDLGFFALPFTAFAVIGIVNALNMFDGIDGLAGGVTVITLISFLVLAIMGGRDTEIHLILILIFSILPFIFFNLGFFGANKKIFLGDAGTMFLGFVIGWLLSILIYESPATAHPVMSFSTFLWFFALPIADIARVMFIRISRGLSPFSPDRSHIHHLILNFGLSKNKTTFIILLASVLLSFIGMAMELFNFPDFVSFIAFSIFFIIYFFGINNLRSS